jgi:hypothetical protein
LIFSAVLCFSLLMPPIIKPQQVNAAGTLSVTSAYWQIGGSTVTTAYVGDSVTAKAVITAQGGSISGTYTIEVIKDISWDFDEQMAQASGSVSLESGASQTISVLLSPDEASGQNSVDGYFIVVWYNSTKIYTMSSRLSVTATPTTTPKPTATATQAAGTVSVTNSYWQVGGSTATTAQVGDSVVANAVITAQDGSVSGTWKIQVIKDISWASDEELAQTSGIVSLGNGESQTLSLSWSPDEASGQNSVDGYFIVVWYNSTKIYTMSSRLAVTTGNINVTSAYWQVGSSNVTTAQVEDAVVAKAVLTAQGGSVSGTWKIQVIKAINWGFDQEMAQSSGSVSLGNGETQTLSLSWSPDQASGEGDVEGYFIVVWFDDTKIYEMTSRLTVATGDATITNVYWQVGSSSVTTAHVGDTVKANVVVQAQGGSIYGTLKILVSKDIPMWPDSDYAEYSVSINISEGQSNTYYCSFSPDEASSDAMYGYRIAVYFNGVEKYVMDATYPPRLAVTSGSGTATTATPTSTHMPTPTPRPPDWWRKNLRSGDILLSPLQASGFGHVGICYGTDSVVEALSSGVELTDIDTWDDKQGVYVLRVNCGNEIAAAAASLAFNISQRDTEYQDWYLYAFASDDLNSSMWYCSEIVWAVYYNLGIEIEYTPDDYAVSPWEIYMSPNTQVIVHDSAGPNILTPDEVLPWFLHWLTFLAECPVDLVVTDPDGLTISRDSNEIPDAVYVVDDFNNDGSPETWISISEGKIGTYNTTVVPQVEAQPTDTYTLRSYQQTGMTTIAENVMIEDIPSEPYTVKYSGEVASSGLGVGAWAGIAIGIVIALVIVVWFLLGKIFGWKPQRTGKK